MTAFPTAMPSDWLYISSFHSLESVVLSVRLGCSCLFLLDPIETSTLSLVLQYPLWLRALIRG